MWWSRSWPPRQSCKRLSGADAEKGVWYISPMRLKGLAIFAVLLALSQAPAAVGVQASAPASANRQTPPVTASSAGVPQETASPAPKTEGEGGIREIQPSHMSVANPAP